MIVAMSDELKDLKKRIEHIDEQLLLLLHSRISLYGDLHAQLDDETFQDFEQESVRRLQKINPSRHLDEAAIERVWERLNKESSGAQAE